MIFPNIPVIPYEGPQSTNPLAFKFYNPDQIVAGKTMKEHLPFAMAWWHNSGIGAKIRSGEATLEELAAYAEDMGAPALPGSGRQEYLESVVNNILFC